jgi:hypothetical protein
MTLVTLRGLLSLLRNNKLLIWTFLYLIIIKRKKSNKQTKPRRGYWLPKDTVAHLAFSGSLQESPANTQHPSSFYRRQQQPSTTHCRPLKLWSPPLFPSISSPITPATLHPSVAGNLLPSLLRRRPWQLWSPSPLSRFKEQHVVSFGLVNADQAKRTQPTAAAAVSLSSDQEQSDALLPFMVSGRTRATAVEPSFWCSVIHSNTMDTVVNSFELE